MRELNNMQITFNEITNNKYVQIYLTKEELEKKETKEIIENYKKDKYSIAFFRNRKGELSRSS